MTPLKAARSTVLLTVPDVSVSRWSSSIVVPLTLLIVRVPVRPATVMVCPAAKPSSAQLRPSLRVIRSFGPEVPDAARA